MLAHCPGAIGYDYLANQANHFIVVSFSFYFSMASTRININSFKNHLLKKSHVLDPASAGINDTLLWL